MVPDWLYPIVVSGAIGYWTQRLQRRTEQAESRLERLSAKAQDAEVRVARCEERIDSAVARADRTDEALDDIREHMVRRADLDALKDFLKEMVK